MRLIDADALRENMKFVCMGVMAGTEPYTAPLTEIDNAPTIEPEQQWIPCSERLPEEDHWLGGSGRQFSDEVMVSVANYDDDIWIDISQTIDGQWALELPSHCEIIAWIPLPEPYKEKDNEKA